MRYRKADLWRSLEDTKQRWKVDGDKVREGRRRRRRREEEVATFDKSVRGSSR